MKTFEEKIRIRVLVPLGLAIVALLCASIITTYWLQQHHINDEVKGCLEGVQELFHEHLREDAFRLNGLIDFLKRDKDLQNIWLAKDRDALLSYARPLFEDICSKYKVTHFYFHGLDRVCFLRVHKPSRRGDYIERFTLDEAVREGKPVYGIELGPLGTFTLRVVHPWRIDGKLAGYIELGEEIEHITPELKEVLGVELFFTINKSYLDRAGWEEGMKMLGHTGDWDQFSNFVIIDRTMQQLPGKLNEYLKQLSSCTDSEHLSRRFKMSSGRRSFIGGFLPLSDAGDNNVGNIVVLNDITANKTSLQTLSAFLIMVGAIITIALFGLFYLYIGRIERRLIKAHDDLRTEITDRKQAEEQIQQQGEFLKKVLESLTHPFYVIDANDYTIKMANSAANLGSLSENSTCYALTHKRSEPCNGDEEPCPIKEVKKTKKPVTVEHVHYDRDGNVRYIEVHGYPIFDSEGNVSQMIEYCLDITERKQAEEQIKTSLEEKEVLLREIHHRVKNNMQIISSLMRLQSRSIEDEKGIAIFTECQNRVKAMALIHTKLYQSESLSNINFSEYVKELAQNLMDSYDIDPGKIALTTDVEKVSLGVDLAAPCGLLVNELISNSLKHAFPKEASGEIKIYIHPTENGQIELTISDNGVGFPEELDIRKTKSLGLQLVTTLAENQLQGKIELNRGAGTEFKITFNNKQKDKTEISRDSESPVAVCPASP